MKLIGIAVILAACVMAGYSESRKLSLRAEQLEKFIQFITNAKTEIRYSAMPVHQIVEKHSEGMRLLSKCAEYCGTGLEFPAAWKRGVQEGTAGLGLKKEDLKVMREFGEGLGATDLDGQLAHCELYLQMVSSRLEDAKKEKATKSKLYLMLGVSAGLAAALLLW